MRGRSDGFQVVLATNNAKKLAELRRIVAAATRSELPVIEVLGLSDIPRYPEPAETESTFADNALLKARACLAATGLPALADDSGLAVDALNGMPGVRSARWAGPDATDAANNELLLRQLYDVPPQRRGARFVCAVALCLPGGTEFVREASMGGRLLTDIRGAGGFGYDPMFIADGHHQSNAEISPAEKDAISHRGQALRAILPQLLEAARAHQLATEAAPSPTSAQAVKLGTKPVISGAPDSPPPTPDDHAPAPRTTA